MSSEELDIDVFSKGEKDFRDLDTSGSSSSDDDAKPSHPFTCTVDSISNVDDNEVVFVFTHCAVSEMKVLTMNGESNTGFN